MTATAPAVPRCPVVHFEMPYRDRERAARFYAAAFGWTHQMLGPEMGDYMLVNTVENGPRPGVPPEAPVAAIHGGFYPFKADWPMQHPSVVVAVENVHAAMARIVAAGGQVLGEPMTIPCVGEYVAFVDTEGNHNSILQPSMGQPDCSA